MQGLGSWLLLEGGTALGTGVVRAPSLLGVTAKNASSHMSPGRPTGGGSHFLEQIKLNA